MGSEKMSELYKNDKQLREKIPLSKENPLLFKIAIGLILVVGFFQTLFNGGSSVLSDFFFQFLGSITPLILIPLLLCNGLFDTKLFNKFSRLGIFMVVLIFLSFLQILGLVSKLTNG